MRTSCWTVAIVVAVLSFKSCVADGQNPCKTRPTQPNWHVFVDERDRFCFEYPPQYKVAPTVAAPGIGHPPANEWVARLATNPRPMVISVADDGDNAAIDVIADGARFLPSELTRFAPTGLQDEPPKLIHTAHLDFYFYGPGGGGVDYPDAFYFGLKGKTFSLLFWGPYKGDKSPAEETRAIEPLVLASMRKF